VFRELSLAQDFDPNDMAEWTFWQMRMMCEGPDDLSPVKQVSREEAMAIIADRKMKKAMRLKAFKGASK